MLVNKRVECGSSAKIMIKYGKRNKVLVKDAMNVCRRQRQARALYGSSGMKFNGLCSRRDQTDVMVFSKLKIGQ